MKKAKRKSVKKAKPVREPTIIELRLPREAVEFYQRAAKLCGLPVGDIMNVALALFAASKGAKPHEQ